MKKSLFSTGFLVLGVFVLSNNVSVYIIIILGVWSSDGTLPVIHIHKLIKSQRC